MHDLNLLKRLNGKEAPR